MPSAGTALLRGAVRRCAATCATSTTLFGQKADLSRAFAEYLHSFAWLRDLSSVATRAQATPIAEDLMRRWLDAHADKVTEPAWRADLWGRRILFWTAHAPLILSSTDLVYRSRVLNTLARGARHIDRGAEKMAPGAPRIAAMCGVVARRAADPRRRRAARRDGGGARRARSTARCSTMAASSPLARRRSST